MNNIQIAISIVFVIIIVFYIYYSSNKQTIIRTLSKLPQRQMNNIRTNEFTKITGKALAINKPFSAPYSKRKCVFYKIKIEEKRSSGKSSYWKTLVKEERFQEFYIKQNDEYAIVKLNQHPKNFKNYLVVDKKKNSGTFNDANPKFEALLNSYNINSTGFLGFNKTLRYTEAIIEIGENITAAGIAKRETLKKPIRGYSYSKIIALKSSEKQEIIITDLQNLKSKKRI